MECLPGKNIKLFYWPIPKTLDKKLMEQTGFYAAKINSIKTEGYGFFKNKIAKTKQKLVGLHKYWHQHLNAAFKKNLGYLTNTKVVSTKERVKLEHIFKQNRKLITDVKPRLIQNDIADWNQLAQKNKVTGIIDWDECFSGDPVMEFAAWSLFFPKERMKHFKRGYLRFSMLPKKFEEKYHLYRIRYLISKLTLRKKKLEFKYADSVHMQQLLKHGLKTLKQELHWYGVLK